uniref:DUF1737 domain-containing protein n=1 Tax=viral metagenome TaxID=1070528 RepID=A0A6M3K6A9_9ZZZZ
MKTKITTQIEGHKITEVKLVRTDKEANELLSQGWELMNAGVSHLDNTGYQAKAHYILAKIGEDEKVGSENGR